MLPTEDSFDAKNRNFGQKLSIPRDWEVFSLIEKYLLNTK